MEETRIINEGNMSLTLSNSNSGEFYSIHQSSNRSLSAVILLSYFLNIKHTIKKISIADVCCGIGSRSLCYLLYFKPKLDTIVIGYDNHKKSIELANTNKIINQLNDYANYIYVNDAKEQLLNTNVIFDLIEIDPFGSPISFIKSSLKCINKSHGILALTFTDKRNLFIIKNGGARFEFGLRKALTKSCMEIIHFSFLLPTPIACWSFSHGCRIIIKVSIPHPNTNCIFSFNKINKAFTLSNNTNNDINNIPINNHKYDKNELKNIYCSYNYKYYGEVLFSKIIYCKSVVSIKEENFTNNMIFSKNLMWCAKMLDINLIQQAILSLTSSSSSSLLYLDNNRMVSILQSLLSEADFFNQIYLLNNQSVQQQKQYQNNSNILWSTYDLPSLYVLINYNKYNQIKSCPSSGQLSCYLINQGFLSCCLTSDSRCIVSNAHLDVVKEAFAKCISNSIIPRSNSFQINENDNNASNNSSIYISDDNNCNNITDIDCLCKKYNNLDKYKINKHDCGKKRIFLDIVLENNNDIRKYIFSECKWIENNLLDLNIDLLVGDRDYYYIDKNNIIDNDYVNCIDGLDNEHSNYTDSNTNEKIINDIDVNIVNQSNLINNEYNSQNVHVIILRNRELPYDLLLEEQLLETLEIDVSMIGSVTHWDKDYDNDGRYNGDLIIKWCIDKQIEDKKEWKNNKKNILTRPLSLFLIIINNSCLTINDLIRLPSHIVFLGINNIHINKSMNNISSLLFASKGSFEICCSTSFIFNINIKFICNSSYLITCKDFKKNLFRIHGKDSILLIYNCNFNYMYENNNNAANNDIKKLKQNNNNINNESFMNIINITSSGLFYCENCNIIEDSLANLEEKDVEIININNNKNKSNVIELVCIYLCGPNTSCICHNLTVNSNNQLKNNKNYIKNIGLYVAASSILSIYKCNVFKCEIGLKVVDGGICNSYQCNINNNNKNGIEVFGVSSLKLMASYVCNNNGNKISFILLYLQYLISFFYNIGSGILISGSGCSLSSLLCHCFINNNNLANCSFQNMANAIMSNCEISNSNNSGKLLFFYYFFILSNNIIILIGILCRDLNTFITLKSCNIISNKLYNIECNYIIQIDKTTYLLKPIDKIIIGHINNQIENNNNTKKKKISKIEYFEEENENNKKIKV